MTTPLRGVHVAVIGDDGDAADVLTQTLRHQGALVTTHTTARSVMRLMQVLIVSVVVVDVSDTTDASLALIHAIRALPASEGGRVPVIALCDGGTDVERRVVAEDVDSVVKKPVHPAELARTVSAVFAAAVDHSHADP